MIKPSTGALIALSLASALAGAAAACSSRSCTEIGCESNLTFDFDEYLAAGEYEVVVESTSGDATCTLTVEADRSSDYQCSGDLDVDPSVSNVVIYATPETASLEITSSGDAVASAEATPEYEDNFPNGPECDLYPCQVAFVDVDVP